MKVPALFSLVASILGAVLSGGVAIHEWNYHEAHPHATGVSGVLTVLSVAVVLGCLSAAAIALAATRSEQ